MSFIVLTNRKTACYLSFAGKEGNKILCLGRKRDQCGFGGEWRFFGKEDKEEDCPSFSPCVLQTQHWPAGVGTAEQVVGQAAGAELVK